MKTIPLHRAFDETLRLRFISTSNCTNLMTSRALAAHLYVGLLSHHARVYRVCSEAGMRGRSLGSDFTTFASIVS